MRTLQFLMALSLLAAGCAGKDSLVDVNLTATPALSGITRVHVEASAGGVMHAFDRSPAAAASTPLDLGIGFPRSITGNLVIAVSVYGGTNLLGTGQLTTPIVLGQVTHVDLPLMATMVAPTGDMGLDMTPAPPSSPDMVIPATLTIDRALNDFGQITVGHSATTTFKITNNGSVATSMPTLAMNTVAGQAGDFAITTTCNAAIQALDSCSVSATLTPSAAGDEDETFTISAGSDSVMGEVKGQALTPGQISLTPDSGDCGAALLGHASTKTASFVATNTGQTTTSTLVVGTNDKQFVASGCNQTLAPNGMCTVTVTFTAGSQRGTFSESLTVGNGASDTNPATATITGVAQSPPIVSISPSTSGGYSFASGPHGTQAGTQTFTVTNSGDVPTATLAATVVSGGNSGDFIVTDHCGGAALAVGPPGCTVAVAFTPGATGTRTTTLDVNGATSPLATLALSGAGTPVWTLERPASPPAGSLRSVWTADATGAHVWTVGDNGATFHRAATGAWTASTGTASGDMLTWITGTGPTDQWAIAGSTLYRSSGDNVWHGESSETTSTYGGIFAFGANDVWVTQTTSTGGLGNSGLSTQALQYTQSGMGTPLTAASGCDMLWGASDAALFCAYNSRHCTTDCSYSWGMAVEDATGNNWTTVQVGSRTTASGSTGPVWGTSATDVYVGVSADHVQHYSGSSNGWAAVDPSAPMGVTGIWGSSATNVYFVGSFGVSVGNGSSWGAPTTFANSFVPAGIHGSGPNDIYVVGADATGMAVYHWY